MSESCSHSRSIQIREVGVSGERSTLHRYFGQKGFTRFTFDVVALVLGGVGTRDPVHSKELGVGSNSSPAFTEIFSSEIKTQLEFGITRVQGIPHSPKSVVRGRYVRSFESTWQFCLMLLNGFCAQLFVLNSVSRTRFQELELSQKKETNNAGTSYP